MVHEERSECCSVTYFIIVSPFLVSSQSMAIEDLYVCPWSLRRYIETQIFFKLELSLVGESKLLCTGGRGDREGIICFSH